MNYNYGGQPVQGNGDPYNNGMGYCQNSGMSSMPNQYQQNNRPHREIQRVEGEAGIKAYQLYPNESVIAVDSTADDILWVKACDSTVFPTIRKARFSFDEQSQTNNDYVSRKDFDELSEKLNKLLEELGGKSNS